MHVHTKRGGLRLMAATLATGLVLAGCGGRDDGGDSASEGGAAENVPGVTDTTIKLGTSFPLSGPASAYSTITKGAQAHFEFVNENGGVNGRKIEYEVLDDGYEPPRAVSNSRRLITQEEVFALFNTLGTPPNLAIWDYVNQQEVPHVFIATGATEFGADIEAHPWTIGWQPNYQTEAAALAQYLENEQPDAKVAVLFQNDGFGKDLLGGFEKAIEGTGVEIVARESYEVTDPSVASQVKKLAGSGADAFLNISTPKFAAQAIATVAKSDWKPTHMISNVAASKSLVFKPVGLEAATGILAPNYLLDPSSEEAKSDPDYQTYVDAMEKFAPDADPTEAFNVYGWASAATMVAALEKAGEDLTREGFMEAVRSLDTEIPMLLPGIKVQTGPDDGYPIEAVQIQRFDGENWEAVGDLYDGEAAN